MFVAWSVLSDVIIGLTTFSEGINPVDVIRALATAYGNDRSGTVSGNALWWLASILPLGNVRIGHDGALGVFKCIRSLSDMTHLIREAAAGPDKSRKGRLNIRDLCASIMIRHLDALKSDPYNSLQPEELAPYAIADAALNYTRERSTAFARKLNEAFSGRLAADVVNESDVAAECMIVLSHTKDSRVFLMKLTESWSDDQSPPLNIDVILGLHCGFRQRLLEAYNNPTRRGMIPNQCALETVCRAHYIMRHSRDFFAYWKLYVTKENATIQCTCDVIMSRMLRLAASSEHSVIMINALLQFMNVKTNHRTYFSLERTVMALMNACTYTRHQIRELLSECRSLTPLMKRLTFEWLCMMYKMYDPPARNSHEDLGAIMTELCTRPVSLSCLSLLPPFVASAITSRERSVANRESAMQYDRSSSQMMRMPVRTERGLAEMLQGLAAGLKHADINPNLIIEFVRTSQTPSLLLPALFQMSARKTTDTVCCIDVIMMISNT